MKIKNILILVFILRGLSTIVAQPLDASRPEYVLQVADTKFEAKDYFTKKGKMLAYTKAVAVVQKSGQDNLPSGFLESFKKPIYPVKNFETRKEAIQWLKSVEG